MNRKDYRNYTSKILYFNELKRMENIDIYRTKNDLFTEYTCLFASVNCQIYPLLKSFSFEEELQFYLYLDILTYLPFEKLGYEYLNAKLEKENNNLIKFKYDKIMKLFNYYRMWLDEVKKDNIKLFLNNYYNDVFEINVINLAIISLRLFHRYVTIMNFEGGLASMKIHKKISETLDKITDDVINRNLKEININDYLPEFDYSNKLTNEMIEYIELCLQKEKSPEGIRFNYNNLIYIDHPYKNYFDSKKIYNSNIFYFYCHEYHNVDDTYTSYLEYFVNELKLSREVYFEAHFYEDYDSIIYNPFGKAGFDYLNNKNVLLKELKFNKTMELLHKNLKHDEELIEVEILKIKEFYNDFYNDIVKIDAKGIATIYRRVCVDLEEQIVLNNILTKEEANLYFAKKIKEIINDIKNNNLKEIRLSNYLGESKIKDLNENQIAYLEENFQVIFANN